MGLALKLALAAACTIPLAHPQQYSEAFCQEQFKLIPRACCPNGQCGGEIPNTCTKTCAKVFKPMWWKCRHVMAVEGQGDVFAVFMKKCMAATNSHRKLPGDHGQWDIGNSGSSGQSSAARSRACCEEKPQWKGKAEGTPVCGFSPRNQGSKCYSKATQAQAAATCKQKGARLCTNAELMAGEATATGCGHDQRPVWSSDSCGSGKFKAVQVRGVQDKSGCAAASTAFAIRCCADYCEKGKIPSSHGNSGRDSGNHNHKGKHKGKRCAGGRACNKGHALPPELPPPAKANGGKPYGTDKNTAAGPVPRGAKNVLMLVIDDWRTEIKSLYDRNYIHTPNIDKFMQTAVGFKKAYVQQAICGATRASFLTGRRPETTRIYDLHHYWREVSGDYVSIPQHFAENGYVTKGMGKLMHPVCGRDIDKPGECDPKAWTLPYFHSPTEKHWTCNSRSVKQQGAASRGCQYAQNSYKTVSPEEEAKYPLSDTLTAKTASTQLKTFQMQRESRPFFLGVGFHKPHLPFTVPKRHVDKYPIWTIKEAKNNYAPWDFPRVAWSAYGELRSYPDIQRVDTKDTQKGWVKYGKWNPFPNATFPVDTAKALRQHYFGAVTFADENVGIVLDTLHSTGYDKNTVVVLFGDHGWQLGEHGEWCKHTDFDIATNVPLVLRVPGLTDSPGYRTRVSNSFMELVDVFPTLSDFAGIPVPPTCPMNPKCHSFGCSSDSTRVRLCTEGQSMRTVVNRCASGGSGCHDGKRAAFSVYPHYHGHGGGSRFKQANGYSMTTRYINREWRLTEWVPFDMDGSMDWWNPDVNPGKFDEVRNWCLDMQKCDGSRELYDHTSDPDENRNLAMDKRYVSVVAELSKQLRIGWRGAMLVDNNGGGH